MERNYRTLGENIKKKADEKGITIKELAEKAGVTTVSMFRYIEGRRVPREPLIYEIARILDCTVEDLWGIEKPEQIEECGNDTNVRKSSLTDIYIRDKETGTIRRVGDDQHDQLVISGDGHLHYFNLHNGDGCTTGDRGEGYGYEFVPNTDENGFNFDPRERKEF